MSEPDVTGTGVTRGDIYQQIPAQEWSRGITPDWDVSNLSASARLYTSGSWTSAPTENLAFWFSGMQSAESQPLDFSANTGSPGQANTSASVFVEFDLSVNTNATSRNLTWPGADPRAEGALVWLPYSQRGILLAFGGIQVPADMSISNIVPDEIYDAQAFMTHVLVYDIENETWAVQETVSDPLPPQRASFCTVVAAAPDGNSHHIYVYGGYDGTYASTNGMQAYDDVWVLSIPSFHWTKLADGNTAHRRQNHVCVQVTPNQMLSIGGNIEWGQPFSSPSVLDVFDLSKGEWTQKYQVNNTEYTVPAVITDNIGDPSEVPDDLNANVTSWVKRAYGKDVQTFSHNCSVPLPVPTPPPSNDTGDSTPPWRTPVIAAVCSGVGVAIILTAVWCMCFRRKGSSGSEKRNSFIANWLRKSSNSAAPNSVTDADTENTVIATPSDSFGAKEAVAEVHEMPGYGHGPAQLISGSSTASPFPGSAEVDAQSRFEMMGHGRQESISLRQHPFHPLSLSGDHIMSVRSDSISHPSETLQPSRHYGHVSPYELAHDRSRENLLSPPTDLALGEPQADGAKNPSTHSLGVGAEHVQSPVAITPTATIARKSLNVAKSSDHDGTARPVHRRNQSSMSSSLPNLPSPGPEEDRRRSQLIDSLPDASSRQSSPGHPQTPKRSVYKENLDT